MLRNARGILLATIGAFLISSYSLAENPSSDSRQFWPQWRGPAGNGVAALGDPPTEWSETKNIRWKVAIPGRGHASPIVWGDRIYVQTAIIAEQTAQPEVEGKAVRDYRFVLIALDRRSGAVVWEQTLCQTVPHEPGHKDASPVSNSPATDGEYVYAYFGSRGLYCLDMTGKLVWKKDFGQMTTRRGFGEGSSPALYADTLVLVWDEEGDSFIVALDKKTGNERWRIARDEPTSWATPIVVAPGGKPQVIASATNRIRSYDLESGALLWECGGMTGNVIPTPAYDDELVYCISGFRGSALLAIRYAEAQGDITGTPAVAWTYDGKGTPYVPSPALYEGKLYFLQVSQAILSCVDARTGKADYAQQRLEQLDGVYASPVAAAGRVYIVGRNGKTPVLQAGAEFQVLATNVLDDEFSASPAIAGKELFLRGHEHLYCIAGE